MKTNPNQPISAFTELDEQGRPYQFYKGLTKREHFAGLALQGLLSKEGYYDRIICEGGDITERAKIAQAAVIMADLVIAELNRTQD